MSVKDEVVKAQNAALDGEQYAKARELTEHLYDQIGALPSNLRLLLIQDAIARGKRALESDDHSDRFLGQGLLALAGYTAALLSEESGDTTTGDRRINEVFRTYADLTKEYVMVSLGIDPESAALLQGQAEEVFRRVKEDGTPFEVAYREVTGQEFGERAPETVIECGTCGGTGEVEHPDGEPEASEKCRTCGGAGERAPETVQASGSEDRGYGLYL